MRDFSCSFLPFLSFLLRSARTFWRPVAVTRLISRQAPSSWAFGHEAFQAISLSGGAGGNIKVVSAGIAAALVATAAGLLVAIYAVIAYNYFVARVNSIAVKYKVYCEEFLYALGDYAKGKAAPHAADTAPAASSA